jgi:hypothetical protein
VLHLAASFCSFCFLRSNRKEYGTNEFIVSMDAAVCTVFCSSLCSRLLSIVSHISIVILKGRVCVDHYDDDDDEEPIFVPKQSSPNTEQTILKTNPHIPLSPKPLLDWRELTVQDLWFELSILAALAVYLVVFFLGRRINRRIAKTW